MGLGETKSCAEKQKKAEGALRYTLIGAFELAKSSREVREGGSHKGKKEGAHYGRRERRNNFGVTFQSLYFSKKGRIYIHGNLEDLAIRSSHL